MEKHNLTVAIAVFAAAISLVDAFGAELRIVRRTPLAANVGVVSVGPDTHWKQCPGEVAFGCQVSDSDCVNVRF